MSLRAVEHIFNGATTPIASYDSTKTNLGTLMIQKSGPNPEDNFVGPFPVAIARPMEESTATAMMYPHAITYSSTIDWIFLVESSAAIAKKIYLYEYNKVTANYNWKGFFTANIGANATNVCRGFRALRYLHTTGTVSVAAPASVYATGTVTVTAAGLMTHSATGFLQTHVGLMVGLGSTDPTKINCWHPIIAYLTTSTMTLSGVSSAYAAGTSFVIASCVVTGSSTKFVDEGIAAGATVTNATGGLGPRIGFGSTDPTQITQWFQIGRITDNTTINLVTSPGVIASGTSYVIEELRFVLAMTNTTAANGGLFLVKGIGYMDFQTNTVAGPLVVAYIASAIDNQRGVYWLSDAGTTTGTNVVTNQNACGCAIQPEINKGLHYAYVLDAALSASAYAKVYRYNLRATGTITSGKMLMSIAYYTTGTVGVSGTAVTGSGTTFTIDMIGMKIGFGSKSPALITTWYTIESFTSTTSITLSSSAGTVSAGTDFIVDSADVLCTAPTLIAGTMSGINNGRIGTLSHGPGKDVESLYFVTTTRIYRAAMSNIYAGNMNWISENRPEIPPGSSSAFPLTSALNSVEIVDVCDRLLVLTTGATAFHNYITKYPTAAGDPFDSIWGVDDKQQDLPTASANLATHFNTGSQTCSVWSENGIAHIIQHGYTANLCQMYALPMSAHWTYASTTNQRVITPAINTPNCANFEKVLASALGGFGGGEFSLTSEQYRIYCRTKGIMNNTGEWTLVGKDGDLSGLSGYQRIQFMFEFSTIGWYCIPARIFSITVTYDDTASFTDSHFQPSASLSSPTNKIFAWRFATAFGGTVPALRVRLYNAITGDLLVDDSTVNSDGTWEKATDGTTWVAYGTLSDKSNETTYIRYTPSSLGDNIKVRAVLTQ